MKPEVTECNLWDFMWCLHPTHSITYSSVPGYLVAPLHGLNIWKVCYFWLDLYTQCQIFLAWGTLSFVVCRLSCFVVTNRVRGQNLRSFVCIDLLFFQSCSSLRRSAEIKKKLKKVWKKRCEIAIYGVKLLILKNFQYKSMQIIYILVAFK